jgi:hypothetical protein
MHTLKLMVIVPVLLTLISCGGSGNVSSNAGSSSGGTPKLTCNGTTTGSLNLSGQVTFEKVPHNGFGLDYTPPIPTAAARGVTVQALNGNTNAIITSTQTDSFGNYSMTVPNNTDIKVRVIAELVKTGSLPNWQFHVVDNTNSNAQYVMDGNSACTGAGNETRNLTALSGWGGSSYTSTRSAAPFAILDTIYDGIQLVLTADTTANFPALNVYWSSKNTDVSGNAALGQITTSHFDGSNGIYLLGDQNNDTDEYDPSVIAHEWGHYLEANFSHSDSIGGPHYTGDRLDMRVAFGEGFGNAFSSMVRKDPVYSDSNGNQQAGGFGFNVETESAANPGWYSESSVEKILYDLYDNTNDATDFDTLSLGFTPIWNVLVNEERTEPVFTSIFKFITALKAHDPGDAAAIDAIVNAQNIHVADVYGSTETNNAGNTNILPVFHEITTTTAASNVCVTRDFGRGLGSSDYNVLGMNQYIRFTPATPGNYQFTVSGNTSGDPDAVFYNDAGANYHGSSTPGVETFTETLSSSREYMLEFYDYNILTNPSAPSPACYTVSVIQK